MQKDLGRTASYVEIRDADEVAATPVRVVTQGLKICYSPYITAGAGHFFHPRQNFFSSVQHLFACVQHLFTLAQCFFDCVQHFLRGLRYTVLQDNPVQNPESGHLPS